MRQLWRRLSIALVALVALALLGGFVTGGYGILSHPYGQTKFSLSAVPPTQRQSKPNPVAPPCWYNTTPGAVQYDTGNAAVVTNRFFGASLAPKSLPLVKPNGYVPSKNVIRSVVCAEWNALRHRPEQALATTTVVFPQLRSYYGSSWVTQLGMLSDHGDWANANLVFIPAQAPPPHTYSMGMDYHVAGANAPPQVFMTHAHITGWYLTVPFHGYTLWIRIGCGGQPSFNAQGRYQALLQQYYPLNG